MCVVVMCVVMCVLVLCTRIDDGTTCCVQKVQAYSGEVFVPLQHTPKCEGDR